jgi:hypothetical protein
LTSPHINDMGRPVLAPPFPALGEQRLVQAERVDVTDPSGILDQRSAVRE